MLDMNTREIYAESLSWIRAAIMQLEGAMYQKAHVWDPTDLQDARDAQAILKNLEDTFEKKVSSEQEEAQETN